MQLLEIQKLPENLINQIKAGEVIERPFNAIKELVENSIDASSTHINIEILDGGKQLIRISDNGIGIPPEQLLLALERHATSKINKFEDLESLVSFGFRGEALPSIASISNFKIKSKTSNQEFGKEICFENGIKTSEKQVSMPQGTVVQIKDLFINVPVRLKFLKSTSTEFSHINDYLIAMSLSKPNISFRFSHNGREVFNYHAKQTHYDRFQNIVGVEANEFVEINFSRGSFKLTGFAGLPSAAKQTPSYFITFVNGRYVKDKIARSAIIQAYQGLLIKGLIPPAIIFIEVDPSWIDVNAHPSKTEIRFYDPILIQELVTTAIQNSVKEAINKNIKPNNTLLFHQNNTESIKNNFNSKITDIPYSYSSPNYSSNLNNTLNSVSPISKLKTDEIINKNNSQIIHSPANNFTFQNAKFLGQFANCYILVEIENELWIIDQHAFHERILFEEIMNSHQKNKVPNQDLLTPIIIPSNEVITSIVLEQKNKIHSLGFNIEGLKNGYIAIHSYPSILNTQNVPKIFDEIIARIIAINGLPLTDIHPLIEITNKVTIGIQEEFKLHPTQLREQDIFHLFFATMACHSAIRSGEPLNEELANRLLARSNDVDFFSHCPHGRPVIRKFTNKDVASWFQRI